MPPPSNPSLLDFLPEFLVLGVLFFIVRWYFKKDNFTEKLKQCCTVRYKVITYYPDCETAYSIIKKECEVLSVLGFDCEWNSFNYRGRVALLQLATYSGKIFLFRLNTFKIFPQVIAKILEDEKILKVGVSPALDGKYLLHDYGIKVRNTLDLRHLHPTTRGGLNGLAEKVLNWKLDKFFQISDWEVPELEEEQKYYAAQDALAGIEIFKKWLFEQKAFNKVDAQNCISSLICYFNIDFVQWEQKFMR